MKYDVYVGGMKVSSYESYYDVALSKAFWKHIFGKEVTVVEQ